MMKEMTVKAQIGQRVMAGFEGTTVPESIRALVREWKVGNFILFSRNIASKEQTSALCAELQALTQQETGHPALIAIDQEGGTVSRLRDDCAIVPGAMAIAATGQVQNAYEAGLITGEELRAMGINFDLAPVMDVNANPQNPVIGVRSYGDSPEQVAQYGVAMMRGLQDAGVLACAKHFPGHGDTNIDSHLALPCVDKSLSEMEAYELRPFRAIVQAGIAAIMTTHILFPQLEQEKVPATMSRKIITGLLREQMGFDGLVVSDCMMMEAIHTYYGTVNGMLAAAKAGVDMLIVSHDPALARQGCEALAKLIENNDLVKKENERSVARVLRCKATVQRKKNCDLDIVGCSAHRSAVRTMTEQSITLVSGQLPQLDEKTIYVGCTTYKTSNVQDGTTSSSAFAQVLQRALGGDALQLSSRPSKDEIRMAQEIIRGHSAVVLGIYNGNLAAEQKQLMQAVLALGLPTVCIALGNPYDLMDAQNCTASLTTYGLNEQIMDALIQVLGGEILPKGIFPLQRSFALMR